MLSEQSNFYVYKESRKVKAVWGGLAYYNQANELVITWQPT